MMSIRAVVISTVCMLGMHRTVAAAQIGQIGVLTKIRGVHEPPCPASRAAGTPQPALRIFRANAATSVTATQLEGGNFPIQVLDSIVVPRSLDARLLVRSGYGNGLFVLTPDFGRCLRWNRDTIPGGGAETATHASYRIGTHRDTATGHEALELIVDVGAVTVEWSKGLLYVYALTQRIQVTGTEFTVRVDSSFASAFIYVKDGSVKFEGFPGLVASGEQLFWWTPGGVPQRVSSPPSGLEGDYSFHAREVWRGNPHMLRKTAIGVGVVAAAIVVARNCCRPSNRRNGTIVVGLPL
jgi:hypothetical protein